MSIVTPSSITVNALLGGAIVFLAGFVFLLIFCPWQDFKDEYRAWKKRRDYSKNGSNKKP